MRGRRPAAPHTGGEGQLRIRPGRGVVELPDGGAGAHPRSGGGAVDAHGAELAAGEVDDRELLRAHGPVREALVVVPAAAHAEAHPVAAAAEDRGLDVGGVGGRDDIIYIFGSKKDI